MVHPKMRNLNILGEELIDLRAREQNYHQLLMFWQ